MSAHGVKYMLAVYKNAPLIDWRKNLVTLIEAADEISWFQRFSILFKENNENLTQDVSLVSASTLISKNYRLNHSTIPIFHPMHYERCFWKLFAEFYIKEHFNVFFYFNYEEAV